MKHCTRRNGVYIQYMPDENKIAILKCCLKAGMHSQVLKSYTLEEWENIDIYREITSCKGLLPEDAEFAKRPARLCFDEKICYFPNADINEVDFSLFTFCNASCNFCIANKKGSTEIERKLSELYFKGLYQLKGHRMNRLRLSDKGEPLLFKEHTLAFLSSLDYDLDFKNIEITTNGHLIDDNFISLVSNSNVNFNIAVSLNATSSETRKSLMGLDDFENVVSYLDKLVEKLGYYNVIASFVCCEENIAEAYNFLELCLIHRWKPRITPVFDVWGPNQFAMQKSYQDFINFVKCKLSDSSLDKQLFDEVQLIPYEY